MFGSGIDLTLSAAAKHITFCKHCMYENIASWTFSMFFEYFSDLANAVSRMDISALMFNIPNYKRYGNFAYRISCKSISVL